MKKSMLMLVALFMLGACSTVSFSDEWVTLVGGKTTVDTGEDSTLDGFAFSADATTLTVEGDDEFVLTLKKSSADGATYTFSESGYSATYVFSNVTADGGDYKISEKVSGFSGSVSGSFTFK